MADEGVKIDLTPFKQILAAVEQSASTGDTGPVSRAFKVWAHVYRSFVRDRFDRYSKGGGSWPYLSPATLAQRRRKVRGWKLRRGQTWKKKRFKKGTAVSVGQRPKILRDTGVLFAATNPEFVRAPGQLEERIPFGIRVGYGGPGKHKGKKSKVTIATIAGYHQEGGGRLPKRTIIVEPDRRTADKLADVLVRALERARDGG